MRCEVTGGFVEVRYRHEMTAEDIGDLVGYLEVWQRHLTRGRCALMDVVEAGRAIAILQPGAYARTQAEADLWARFYRVLNDAPVGGSVVAQTAQPVRPREGQMMWESWKDVFELLLALLSLPVGDIA